MYAHECALSEKKKKEKKDSHFLSLHMNARCQKKKKEKKKKEKKDSHFLSLWKIAECVEHRRWKIAERVV